MEKLNLPTKTMPPAPTRGEGFMRRPIPLGMGKVMQSSILSRVDTEDWELDIVKKTLMVPPQVVAGGPKIMSYESYLLWGGTRLLFVEIHSEDWAVLEPPQREDAFRENEWVDGSTMNMEVLETETKGNSYLFLILFGTAEW